MLQRYISTIEIALMRVLSSSEQQKAYEMFSRGISVKYAIEYFA